MRFITCAVEKHSKLVKIYNAETYLDAIEMVKEDHDSPFRLKYVRDMDRQDDFKYRMPGFMRYKLKKLL